MTLLLALLGSPAEACSRLAESDPVAYPLNGDSVPAGLAIRPEGQALATASLSLDGENWDALEGDGLGQYFIPVDQPPGTVQLSLGYGDPITVEVLSTERDWPLPEGRPELLSTEWYTAWVSERTTPSCLDVRRRPHTFEELLVTVPASEEPGWGLRVSDSSTNEFWWAHLEPDDRELLLEQDLEASGTLQTGERCLELALYDPLGVERWSEALPCESREQAPGCSSSASRSSLWVGLLGLLALSGLRRRRESLAVR